MKLHGVPIDDTFAEAFPMRAARLIVTARNERWVRECAAKLTGFATSVIGCKVEAGVERFLMSDETPDARPGCAVLFMTMSKTDLPKRLAERVGDRVLDDPADDVGSSTCAELPAERITAAQKSPDEGLVYDRLAWCTSVRERGEVGAVDERDAHHVEVPRADGVRERFVDAAIRTGASINRKGPRGQTMDIERYRQREGSGSKGE